MDKNYYTVIDPTQLTRIESIHRGFLYQHLYAVGCLLLAAEANTEYVLVERDEDIELKLENKYLYIQVKTRSEALRRSDIETSLETFTTLRDEHTRRHRDLTPLFLVVSNQQPRRKLYEEINAESWPKDVIFRWPDHKQDALVCIPPAWGSLQEAVDWTVSKAETIPYSRLSPESLVWKLSSLIHFACTGTAPREKHQFLTDLLPELFEQIVTELQVSPVPPPIYREHEPEPPYESETPVRLIVGHSGSGKTAWASQVSMHTRRKFVYYSISDVSNLAFTSSLVRELASQLFGRDSEILGSILMPGSSGIDSLRAISMALINSETNVCVLIDNAHKVKAEEVLDLINAGPNLMWVFLLQPGDVQNTLEATSKLTSEQLSGWSIETIASEFHNIGCPISPDHSQRIRLLTGGMPLYVQSAALMALERYGGDVDGFCEDLAKLQHDEPTAQEIILQGVLDSLPKVVKDATGLLSLSEVPLTKDEIYEILLASMGIEKRQAAKALRELRKKGILQLSQEGKIKLHDAFRIIAANYREEIKKEIINDALTSLKSILDVSRAHTFDVNRLIFFLKLLPQIGQVETFIELATSSDEVFDELGISNQIKSILIELLSFSDLKESDLFWVLDTLAFWELQRDNVESAEKYIILLKDLHKANPQNKNHRGAILIKEMLLGAKKGDTDIVSSLYRKAIDEEKDEEVLRIVRYDYAYALYELKKYVESENEAFKLVSEYYDLMGLDANDVFAKNVQDIAQKIGNVREQSDNIKHLADSLDLYGRARIAQDSGYGLSRFHAHKFYILAGAYKSALKVGQDVVDDLIGYLNDPFEARSFIETGLLPIIRDFKLLDYFVPVHSQYAVVLAYCGETVKAKSVISNLISFADALPEENIVELYNQIKLINDISEGKVRLPPPIYPSKAKITSEKSIPVKRGKKIGRNEPCPCGSGLKYKKCCGYH